MSDRSEHTELVASTEIPETALIIGSTVPSPMYLSSDELEPKTEYTLESFQDDFKVLLKKLGEHHKHLDETALWHAFDFAYQQHLTQKRKDGSPYFTHLLETAKIVSDLTSDPISIKSALLHDVVEDPKVPIEIVREKFGKQVAVIVDGVTKISEISFGNLEEKQAANLRKMILAMAQDPRVILVKLSDRLHNMLTIEWLEEKRRREIARETLDIYAPLAHRLGIYWIKWRLEDLCLKVLDRDAYNEIKNQVASKRDQREELLTTAIDKITEKLHEHHIHSDVQGRAKHFYSIYKKMRSQGRSFDDILDLLAIRIVVSSNDECYAALGHVHALYTPLPDYFSDYIAGPKSNGYRSIHTKVIGPRGHTLEIQIRTREMHEQAELGLAAHWRYKESGGWDEIDSELSKWMRNLIDAQKENPEYEDFLQVLKSDLTPKDIYVISPRGDVYRLPKGSTATDFAFMIHSDVGLHSIAAKVNGRIVPLLSPLPNGCTVEIITSAKGHPAAEWLTKVKSAKARNHIKRYFQDVRFEESQKLGQEICLREIERMQLKISEEQWLTVAHQMGFMDLPSFYSAVGSGQLKMSNILRKLAPSQPTPPNWLVKIIRRTKTPKSQEPAVRVTGFDNLMVTLAPCCTPLPGDRIRGFLTPGKGVVVHRIHCKNLRDQTKDPDQYVDVAWDVDPEALFSVKLHFIVNDRKGMLHDISGRIAQFEVNIVSLSIQMQDGMGVGKIELSVKSLSQLSQLIGKITSIPGVVRVRRLDENDDGIPN